MTSAMTTAAAYEMWLGIPAAQHPPHHYALLGLPPQAASEQAVLQAYQQRAMIVGQQLSGPHAAAARRLLGELAAAQACLLNADARAAYDQWLSPRLRGTSTAAALANSSRPAPRSKSDANLEAPPAVEKAFPPPAGYAAAEESSNMLPWLVGGICAGLLAVAVLGVALFGFKRAAPSTVANNSASTTAQNQAQKIAQSGARDAAGQRRTKERERDGARASVTDIEDDVLGQRVAPLTTQPEEIRLDGSVVGPPDSSGAGEAMLSLDDNDDEAVTKNDPPKKTPKPKRDKTKPVDPQPESASPSPAGDALAKLPRSFTLPSRTSGGAEGVLAQLPVKDKDAEQVTLKLDAAGVAGGEQYELLAGTPGFSPGERIWPVQYASASGKPRAVGEYALSGDELSFRWADSAQASDEALANMGLSVGIGGKTVAINQRSPDASAPLKLAVDVGAVSTSAKVDAPPPSAKLFFALDNQDAAFPAHQLHPAAPAAAGDDIDVIFGEETDPYRLAMRVTLVENGAGGVRIEARPMMQSAGDGQKWDLFRPKSVLQTLAQLKQQELLLDSQLDQLQQRYRRNGPQLQQAMDLFNRQAGELQTRIVALEKMHTLCEELNDHGALNYRVLAKLGEREVDLVDSSVGLKIPTADAQPPAEKDDASAIVGPPTAAPVAPPPQEDDEAAD